MCLLVVDWTSVWSMTGIGLGVVFSILILLVFVLMLFGAIFGGKKTATTNKVAVPQANAIKSAPVASASQETEAAIATALYLYFQDVHDEESYKLTIRHSSNPAWHSVLNHRLS
ncbi:MAG: OadG family protein [Bacteroidaceae bacterium]|nr:OadG family protein [Bacteroidaceae bacterium]